MFATDSFVQYDNKLCIQKSDSYLDYLDGAVCLEPRS